MSAAVANSLHVMTLAILQCDTIGDDWVSGLPSLPLLPLSSLLLSPPSLSTVSSPQSGQVESDGEG